jgi:hypothetical protein
MKLLLTPLLAGALLAFAAPVQAVPVVFITTLTGAAEVPPNSSPGTGTGRVTLDEDAQTLRIETSFSGLTANTTVAHIHCCTAAPNTGTAIPATQVPTLIGFPAGVTSGSYDQLFDMTDAASYNPAFITDVGGGSVGGAFAAFGAGIESQTAYLNIHTTEFPAGEIRGFLAPIPEPATVSLLLGGLAVLAMAGRRGRGRPAG